MFAHNGILIPARKEALPHEPTQKHCAAFASLGCGGTVLFFVFTLIQCQITIGSKQQELAAVREQLSAQQAQNEELGRALADGKDAIIERSARADGYAKPNERIWVDLSGK